MQDELHFHRGRPKSRDEVGEFSLHHIEHCFEYLRQNIECISDMTIEWADPEAMDPQINGNGVSHQCRKKVGY
jgi:hypothetical protein